MRCGTCFDLLLRILEPAIEYAQEGYPVGYHSVTTLDNLRDLIRNDSGLREVFQPAGRLLKPGELLKQQNLASTLEGIAKNGPSWFYQGELAQQLTSFLKQKGALLTKEDLTSHISTWGQPLITTYGNYHLYQTPPNSQGLAALLAFNILEGLDFAALGSDSAQLIHYLIEAKKIACQYREQYITDPEFVPVEYAELLDKQFAIRLRKMINPNQANSVRDFAPYLGQSESFIVIDCEGNTIAGTQSLHTPLGAGFIIPETGIILQNNAASFSLNPEHINRLEPQKRPFHALTATMAVLNDKPILVVGASGGDSQFQVQLQVVNKILNTGLNIQEALERPRWIHGGTYLKLEERFSIDIVGELESWGHNTRTIDDWTSQTGEAQAVSINPSNGVLQAGTDPRCEASAAAY